MAGVTSHAAVGVGQPYFILRHAAPCLIVRAYGLRKRRLLVVVLAIGVDDVRDLLDLPDDRLAFAVRSDGGALVEVALLIFIETVFARRQLSVSEHLIAGRA